MTVDQKIVTVFGGTGNQGSAVVHSLLAHKDKTFQVRVITRDPTSEKARKIARLGAHLIQADGLNQEQITRALQGSWGLFINSNSDDHPDDEDLSAPNVYDLDVSVFDAAENAGVKHVVYSSGPNTHRATKGRVHIPGFECKHYAEEYARTYKQFTTFTAVIPASLMECWTNDDFCRAWGGFPWHKKADGKVVLSMPPYGGDGRMPWISLQDDLGDIVHGIFLEPGRYDKKQVQAISQIICAEDMAQEFTQATGTKCQYEPLASWTEIPRDGSWMRDECRRMMFFMNFCGGKWFAECDSDKTAAFNCKKAALMAQGKDGRLMTFRDWFQREQKLREATAGEL